MFVVEDLGVRGVDGRFETMESLSERLRVDWAAAETRALDEALLATINISHVGMVLPYRRGWVFLAEDST